MPFAKVLLEYKKYAQRLGVTLEVAGELSNPVLYTIWVEMLEERQFSPKHPN